MDPAPVLEKQIVDAQGLRSLTCFKKAILDFKRQRNKSAITADMTASTLMDA